MTSTALKLQASNREFDARDLGVMRATASAHARKLSRSFRLSSDEQNDVEQDILVTLLERWHYFDDAIGNTWRSFARPKGAIPPDVKAVHHILEEDVADAPDISSLWATFWEGCGQSDIIAAHNAAFEQHFNPGGGRRWIDTYKCALTVWPDAPAHNNQVLRYWLDLDRSAGFDRALAMPPHRALPDAYVTAHILARLLQACSVNDMMSISSKPALLGRISFGKHKGMKFADVPADYLVWIRDKSDLKEDVKFSAAHWLSVRSRA